MADAPGGAITLSGGRMTEGVVRVDDSVRRPVKESSGFVAALLKVFEHQEFEGAPRYLGQADGMDILSYLPGEVPARFQLWSDEQVAAAGRLLRSMHDATRGSELADRSQVVCHRDAAPNNAVFVDGLEGLPVAFIDFDTASPGSPLEDLGYASWTWCVASKRGDQVARQADQVRILADAYGLEGPERAVLVDAIIEQQARNARFWAEVEASGTGAPGPDAIAQSIAWSRRELAFVVANREVFDAALA
ncbi:phosphotransferase [Kitasatospora purpeofusca]|uniref:phosphotransferase n=1 Tax=Kitasatospora purpeofusca TaxID=67352 RepID=UPI0036919016